MFTVICLQHMWWLRILWGFLGTSIKAVSPMTSLVPSSSTSFTSCVPCANWKLNQTWRYVWHYLYMGIAYQRYWSICSGPSSDVTLVWGMGMPDVLPQVRCKFMGKLF